jgi:regulator of nucleoside diphosphate kinase
MVTKKNGAVAEMPPPTVTTLDRMRLGTLVDRYDHDALVERRYLDSLLQELERAQSIEPEDVPPDVVTMNSTVRLRDEATGEVEDYTLTYPERANIAENRISVLAPMGTALLGARVGEVIEFEAPAGKERFRVEEILYQPEAVGRLDF